MNTKNHEKAAAATALTAALNAKTTANSAKVAADGIQSAATTAETNAGNHHGLEVTLATAKLATLNAAMGTWKGRANALTNAEDTGKTAGTYAVGSKAKLEETALTNLTTAVGKCTSTPTWTGGQCVGTSGSPTATGLVKYALRKKLGVDNITKAKANRETYLDAYCRASQTLGTTAADLAAGKEYYSRANPGKRLDYDFSAAQTTAQLSTGTAYKTSWTWETLGAPVAASQASAQWDKFKCQNADSGSGATLVTGNTGRVYSSATALDDTVVSGIAYAATLPIGDLASKVADAVTERDKSAGLEAKFTTWKALASTSMTKYKAMIDGDNAVHATPAHATTGCLTTGTVGTGGVIILTQYAAATATIAAIATPGNEATGPRPSNLVAVIADASADSVANALTACKNECYKMPSWGLKLSGSGAAEFPNAPGEVCQGVETSTNAANATARKAACKFVSSAIKNTTAADYVVINAASGSNLRCDKRKNTNGLLWRAAAVLAATGAQGSGYPTAVSGYTDFTGAVDTWITKRGLVIASYKTYLQFKTTCQKVGKTYLNEIVNVTRTTARVSGTRGTDITNSNLTEMYEDQWTVVYGEVPAVLATINVASPYVSLAPVDANTTGTGVYSLYLQAKAATATASAAHATAKKEW
jgi:hypothetical protein